MRSKKDHLRTGQIGENIAREYLENKGGCHISCRKYIYRNCHKDYLSMIKGKDSI